jgi:hypothetical protein
MGLADDLGQHPVHYPLVVPTPPRLTPSPPFLRLSAITETELLRQPKIRIHRRRQCSKGHLKDEPRPPALEGIKLDFGEFVQNV